MSVQGPLHRVREVGERRRALRGVGRPRPEPLGGDALLLAPPQPESSLEVQRGTSF